jgi:predicted ATPase
MGTNKWLEKLGVDYELHAEMLSSRNRDLFELRVLDKRRTSSSSVAIADVGYGLSQILPLLVTSTLDHPRIITVEQPEVHIHPGLQAELGELLIDGIQSNHGHQYIVETHSEHLILRLLRRIRETHQGRLPPGHPGLTPEQVSVIYLARGPHGSEVYHLRIAESGEFIDPWPKGFFDERWQEVM